MSPLNKGFCTIKCKDLHTAKNPYKSVKGDKESLISGVLNQKVCVISRPFDAAPRNFGYDLGVPVRYGVTRI